MWIKQKRPRHWDCYTKFYRKWRDIKTRCTSKKRRDYKWYWWRWIKCTWITYQEFKRDMFDTYKEWLSIERVDCDWHYCKENCTWIPMRDQIKNRRCNNHYEYNWKVQMLREWSEELWFNYHTVKDRIRRWWTPEKAFETPIRQINK
jgi:hypothetical protein